MRQDIVFNSHGLKCAGWLTIPENTNPAPIVIMAHGFGGRKEVLLEQYALRFNEIGFATLIFDYRYWGGSEGVPRNMHDFREQLKDWQAALDYVKGLPGIDKNKIVLWGTSFAGGLVLSTAAKNADIAATISQCPMLDGRASTVQFIKYAGIYAAMRSSMHAFYDNLRSSLGAKAHYVTSVGKPGTLAAMATQDAYDIHPRFTAAFPNAQNEEYYNKVTARSLLLVGQYRPIEQVSRVKCPALLLICENDTVAPALAVEKALKLMPNAVPVRFPGLGHFDIYLDDGFKKSVEAQLDFLKKYVLHQGS